MIQNNETLSSKDFSKGLVTRADLLKNQFDQSPNTMDVKWYFDGAIGKRLGASTTNTVVIGSTAAAGWTLDSTTGLSTNLQAFWKMDEVSGTRSDAFDGCNLLDNNTVDSITGIRGNAALFAAANSESLVIQTTSPLETGGPPFSIHSWVYLNNTSTTTEGIIAAKRDPDVDSPTVLLLHCEGTDAATTFTDSSSSGKTVTAVGNAQIDTAQFKFGSASGLFDGTGDFLSTADSADWDFGTGDFTIDFWVRYNALPTTLYLIRRISGVNGNTCDLLYSGGALQFYIMNSVVVSQTWTPTTNTWFHIAMVRNGLDCKLFVDGSQIGSTGSNNSDIQESVGYTIGGDAGAATSLNGWLDEVRITKGLARWTSNFTPPAKSYGIQEYEYSLFVNTDNIVTFRVSSTGTIHDGTIRATSHGALSLNTWYSVVAFHQTGASAHIGVSVNRSANSAGYTGTIRIGSAPFTIGALSDSLASRPVNFLDGRVDEVGFWKRGLLPNDRDVLYGGGTGNTFSAGASGFGWGMFDFGASSIRWLTVAAGTGIVASSNLGATFVTISTSRTQNYQSFERSKNVLICTSDSYDRTLYWAGSAGTFAIGLTVNSAPAAKYSINYQGFLILLNTQDSNGTTRQRGFYYADENLQLTDTWQNSFDIPSSQDDEITTAFILSKFLYISTRTKLYRVAYVGGNPDWSYLKVKDWGFVPRTAKLMTLKGGQVVVGMDWNRRIRAFDGYEDVFVSDNVENDNGICDFAMKKISYAGSGLVVSHAEVDQIEQEYRLNVAIGPKSSQTTHALLLNGRTLSLYPYSNQMYQAMCVAESAGQQHLMSVDRSGFVHILNSGNRDVALAINEAYQSTPIFGETPQQVVKSQFVDTYFVPDSCGTIYYRDAVNLKSTFSEMKKLVELTGTEERLLVEAPLDVPQTFNTYSFMLTSSAGTANPWKLCRWDLVGRVAGIGKG